MKPHITAIVTAITLLGVILTMHFAHKADRREEAETAKQAQIDLEKRLTEKIRQAETISDLQNSVESLGAGLKALGQKQKDENWEMKTKLDQWILKMTPSQ